MPTALDDLALHRRARVVGLAVPKGQPDWERWLAEIGFIPGEPVVLLARMQPGGDPLVVRIGDSTFALRRAEARCVQVEVPK